MLSLATPSSFDVMIEETPLELVSEKSPVLRTRAVEVEDFRDVARYIAPMKALMKAKRGAGLAAPQVGIGLRFFVTDIEGHRVVINPVIKSFFGSRVSKTEGCLTWPGRTTYVARHEGIVVEYTDRNGQQVVRSLAGLSARIFQHETDHLNGVCIFPR